LKTGALAIVRNAVDIAPLTALHHLLRKADVAILASAKCAGALFGGEVSNCPDNRQEERQAKAHAPAGAQGYDRPPEEIF